jgi:hypothetical protein
LAQHLSVNIFFSLDLLKNANREKIYTCSAPWITPHSSQEENDWWVFACRRPSHRWCRWLGFS